MGNVKMNKPISGNELCRPGRPAELPYARVKLHYIIHYINRYVVYVTVYIVFYFQNTFEKFCLFEKTYEFGDLTSEFLENI